jgi:acyl-CoA thioesterase YciA
LKFLTRKLVTPADLNPRGTLHGGILLKWIDEEAGVHAALELNTGLLVTKYMSEIEFVSPVLQGDIVQIGMETTKVGKTSITLKCDVRSKQMDDVILRIEKIVFVRVNKYGQPKAHGASWDED